MRLEIKYELRNTKMYRFLVQKLKQVFFWMKILGLIDN